MGAALSATAGPGTWSCDRCRVVAHLSEPTPIRLWDDHTELQSWLTAEMIGGVIDALDRCRLRSNERGETARSDHGARVPELGLDAGDDAVDETSVAEHDSRLHRLHRVAADDPSGLGDFDAVKLGGA